MADPSRNIPLPIQRDVRQRCGFGCVICGMPLYEYEHMLGWANVERHVAEEITLLCDQHHRERTSGLLPIEAVIELDKNPYNRREGVSKPYDLHYSGSHCEAVIGSNQFTTQDAGYGTIMVPISVDGIPLIGFVLTDGHLLLNVNLFDEFNSPVLRITNNRLLYSISPWDIQLSGRRLVIREASRKLLIDIEFEVPNRIHISRGRFLCNGVEILLTPEYLLVTNNNILVKGCSAVNCPGGLIIGHHDKPLGGFMRLDGVPRYLGDRQASVKWATEMLG